MNDVIIVGTGPAGVAAALGVSNRGLKPLLLDVGNSKSDKQPSMQGNFLGYRQQHDCFDILIGKDFHGLVNLGQKKRLPLKLTAPYLKFVTQNAQRLSPTEEFEFNATQSFSRGGLANAWSAGLYPYNDYDLEGFPIQTSDLEPYYDQLMEEFSIRGEEDDLAAFFGSEARLIPSFKLSPNLEKLYKGYKRKKKSANTSGFYIGHPRVGVLKKPADLQNRHEDSNLELWQGLPNIYMPVVTLDRLVGKGKADYYKKILVQSWSEQPDGIWVEGMHTESGQKVRFKGKKLILAAGAINSARIALQTYRDYDTRIGLFDNPTLQIPLLLPSAIGGSLGVDAFGLVRLNMIWDSKLFGRIIQGTIMELSSVMRADFFAKLPFSAKGNLALIRHLAPGMLGMQLFFPASVQKPARLSLKKNGQLQIQSHPNSLDLSKIGKLLRHFRKWGAWSHIRLVERLPLGSSVHYAGTLPMRQSPNTKYECDRHGKLYGTQNVFVADAACFPALPAKNMSFTMMANAMRMADYVAAELKICQEGV